MSMIGDVDVDVFTPDVAMPVESAMIDVDRNTYDAGWFPQRVALSRDWRKNWRLGNYE